MAQLLIKGTKVAEVVGDTTSLIANTLYHTNGTQIISDDGGTVGLTNDVNINNSLASATFPAGHVIQVVDNPITPAVQSGSNSFYSNNIYATIILKKANSKIAFFPASSPQINDSGDAHYTVHWRYRVSGGTWSSYADTLRIRLKLHGHSSWRELPLGGVGLHSPNQPAGKELEYRVYYVVYAGTVYDADTWGYGTQMHNMTLMEIAA